ncbi:MAG TPA: hypothetical protein VKX17_07410 [Planctomycetota bacterium]|nr:hypothetical protein [Planctomycetota bacterium]
MKRAVQVSNIVLCVLALLVARVGAQEPKPPVTPPVEAQKNPKDDTTKPKDDGKKPKDDSKKDANANGEAMNIDPTEMSDKLKNAVNPPAPTKTIVPRAPVLPAIPEIVLKAFVEAEGKPPAAMLSINGKTQMTVSEGSEISVQGSDHQYLTLKVKKVARDGVEIEIVQLKQTIHVK